MIIKFNPEHAKITTFCSKDEFRPAMMGVLVLPEPDIDLTDAKWYAIATDSFKAIKVPVIVELDDNDLTYTGMFEDGIILSRNIVEHHFKSMKATVNFIEIVFNVDSTVTSFNSSNNEKVVGGLINEKFPPAFGMFKDKSANAINIGFNSTHLNVLNTFIKDTPLTYSISPDNNLVFAWNRDGEVEMLLAPTRGEDGTAGFIGHNVRLRNAITDINNEIKVKRNYLNDITDSSAINRTLDAIRTLNHQKFEDILRTVYINSMHPCDVCSKFFIEDIEELGYDIPDNIDDVIDAMRDAIANEYNRLLETVLERFNVPKMAVPSQYVETEEDMAFLDDPDDDYEHDIQDDTEEYEDEIWEDDEVEDRHNVLLASVEYL